MKRSIIHLKLTIQVVSDIGYAMIKVFVLIDKFELKGGKNTAHQLEDYKTVQLRSERSLKTRVQSISHNCFV